MLYFTRIPCVTIDQKVLGPEKPNIQIAADNQSVVADTWEDQRG